MKNYLTSTKRRILELVDEKHSTQEIADELIRSPRTIETHRHQIIKDFGVHSIYEAIQIAKRKKWM